MDPVTDTRLAELRKLHKPDHYACPVGKCEECDTHRALRSLQRVRAELREAVEHVKRLAQYETDRYGYYNQSEKTRAFLTRTLERELEASRREVERLRALVERWVACCDLSGVMPVSGNIDDQPVMALVRDSRAALAKEKP